MLLNRGSVRRWGSRAAVTAGLVLAGVGWAGCGQVKATELVAGVSSQVAVPSYLQSVVITVYFDDVEQVFEGVYPVYDSGDPSGAFVRLPRTLGVVKGPTEGVVRITVAGFTQPVDDQTIGAFNGSDPEVGTTTSPVSLGGGAQILRRSTQPYSEGQILYVPLPLHYACYSVDCDAMGTNCNPNPTTADSEPCTCKGGQCVPAYTDPSSLPPYNDSLVYGTTNTCFRPFTNYTVTPPLPGCMDYEVTPQLVGDPSDCIFAIPTTPSAAGAGTYSNPDFPPPLVSAAAAPGPTGPGLNVRAVFDNIVSEVLDYEGLCPDTWPPASGAFPQDGYCNYADAPQKFRLAPGLCQQYLGTSTTHEITLLEANAACPPKTIFQPICQDTIEGPPQPDFVDGGVASDDAGGICSAPNVLTPAPSALYILFDKSSGMRDFLGPSGLGEVLGLSLTNPVFQQTVVGLMYTPAQQADCASSQNEFALDIQADSGVAGIAEGTVPFEFSGLAQADIANSLLNQGTIDAGALPSGNAPWYLEAALDGAYTALENIPNGQQFNRRAVMLFYDRDFDVSPTDCPAHADAISEATAAFEQNHLETYAVYLGNADYPDGGVPGNPIQHGELLAQGFSTGVKYFANASSQQPGAAQATAGQALASVVADMGSCVYEIPGLFVPGAQISFPKYPQLGSSAAVTPVTVSYAPSCALDDGSTNALYVFDNQHIRICQNTCSALVTSITNDEIYSAARNAGRTTPLPPLPFNVTWSYACGNIPDAAIVESGSAAPAPDAGEDAAGEDAAVGGEDAGPG